MQAKKDPNLFEADLNRAKIFNFASRTSTVSLNDKFKTNDKKI